ncbi:IS30 family transposase [Symbiopectobacterium purcellii]|uniref:IS30 family transposase n=1 Tax=Symbiopectobacterium purcellii TaxID=2871826 RepID=UPI003F855BA6
MEIGFPVKRWSHLHEILYRLGISISEQRKIYFNHRNTLISLLSNTLIEANTFCKFKTLTADNGPEFALHEQITQITGAQVYFAHPYHSWERGLNEHTNGLIRRFLPKGNRLQSGQSS